MPTPPRPTPPWFKDAVIYQLHVKTFRDSDQDGVGDFAGLTQKLPYLQALGVTAIWLLPFYPSPRRDDGYDIADYCAVHPDYGTLQDFDRFITQAHQRGLRVITELVLNHTSDQHPWFQAAIRAPKGSPERQFYVFSDSPDRYAQTRIIFNDYEPSNWHFEPTANAYYWHRFFHHQPDLNFDNPAVHRALFDAVDFWLDRGVDGFRLDAIPYLYEREGTSNENLPETHAFIRSLRAHVDARAPHAVLLAEANQWPEDAVAYFGDGDECQMSFHFPLMPRLYLALAQHNKQPITELLARTPAIPETCQWALFLRNHDELTLEMVTDAERDALFAAYAQTPRARINRGIRRRLAPLLGGERRAIQCLTKLLLSLPGTPILYYGDELGMGDALHLPDRDGVRTPMQWSNTPNAGFSEAPSGRLVLPIVDAAGYAAPAVNAAAQSQDPRSLLTWTRQVLAARHRCPAFGRGRFDLIETQNAAVLAFLRTHNRQSVLVVANLSPNAQPAQLDIPTRLVPTPNRRHPIEMLGQTPFPPLTETPWPLSLGAYEVFWFELPAQAPVAKPPAPKPIDILTLGPSDQPSSGPWLGLVETQTPDHRPTLRLASLAPAPANHPDRLIPPEPRPDLPPLGLIAAPLAPLTDPIAQRLIELMARETTTERWTATGGAPLIRQAPDGLTLTVNDPLLPTPDPAEEVRQALRSAGFDATPYPLGALVYHGPAGRFTLAQAHAPAPTETLFHRAVAALGDAIDGDPAPLRALNTLLQQLARLLGDFHTAMAHAQGPGFQPEPFGAYYVRSQYEGLRAHLRPLPTLLQSGPLAGAAPAVWAALSPLKGERSYAGVRIRAHGALTLGAVVCGPNDTLQLTALGGPPDRSLSERRQKTAAVRDLATLWVSLQLAARLAAPPQIPASALQRLTEPLGQTLLHTWERHIQGQPFAPGSPAERDALLAAHRVEIAATALIHAAQSDSPQHTWALTRILQDLLAPG